MSTAREIMRGCAPEMLHAVRSGRADPRLLDAFRRQLAGGMSAPIVGERVEAQSNFLDARPVIESQTNQLALF